MRFFRKMVTLKDISELHDRYLNSLLYEEGKKLLKFFLRTCKWEKPTDLIPEFGSSPIEKPPLDAKSQLLDNPSEYVVELYLLQNLSKLEEIVGSGFSEVYNQIYVFGGRFLDILSLHKLEDELIKATAIEIKTDPREMKRGLEELARYMFWVTNEVSRDPEITFGILLTPKVEIPDINSFREKSRKESEIQGIRSDRIKWVSYEIKEKELLFEPIS